ncbi:MAG TPA: hypothetical protein VGA67_04675 [Candidatus Dojkabacteria bacterium]|jgi:hypothetical protein
MTEDNRTSLNMTEVPNSDELTIIIGGESLSNTLPGNPRIQKSPDNRFYMSYEGNILFVPWKIDIDEAYCIGLAHECGHFYDPNGKTLDAAIRKPAPKFEDVVRRYSAKLELEYTAWRLGHPLAERLGVRDESYLKMQITALTAYFEDSIETILLSKGGDKVPNLAIFNPFLGRLDTYTIEELEYYYSQSKT